jgi:nitrous oxidase accessory protein
MDIMAVSKKTTLYCLIFLLTGIGMMFSTKIANGAESRPATELQAEIAKTRPGARLLIQPGIYHGLIQIDKPIHLIANGEVVLDGDGAGDVVTLMADGIELRGFTIQNSGTDLQKDQAGIKINSSNNLILYNRLKHNLHGMYLDKANKNQILDNQIEGLKAMVINSRGNGIHLFHSTENILENNNISFSRDGMYFSYSDNNHVNHNQVHDLRYGLHYMYSNDNLFDGNVFTHNVGGSALMYSRGITLTNNIFREHRGNLGTGLVLNTCDDSKIERNIIENNTRAIFIDSSSRNKISENQITNNFIGIEIPPSSEDNEFYGNSWIGEAVPVLADSDNKTNHWYDLAAKKGNYWSGQIWWI